MTDSTLLILDQLLGMAKEYKIYIHSEDPDDFTKREMRERLIAGAADLKAGNTDMKTLLDLYDSELKMEDYLPTNFKPLSKPFLEYRDSCVALMQVWDERKASKVAVDIHANAYEAMAKAWFVENRYGVEKSAIWEAQTRMNQARKRENYDEMENWGVKLGTLRKKEAMVNLYNADANKYFKRITTRYRELFVVCAEHEALRNEILSMDITCDGTKLDMREIVLGCEKRAPGYLNWLDEIPSRKRDIEEFTKKYAWMAEFMYDKKGKMNDD